MLPSTISILLIKLTDCWVNFDWITSLIQQDNFYPYFFKFSAKYFLLEAYNFRAVLFGLLFNQVLTAVYSGIHLTPN